MSALVWRAVQELATVWRASPFVHDYVTGIGAAGGNDRSAAHIQAQPFYLSMYLPTVTEYELIARSVAMQTWLHNSDLLGHAYTTVIEWLRSRLSGYPFPDAPQLSPNSPWTSFNVSMWVPWLIEFRHQQLEHKSTPPTIPFLAVDPATQLQAGTHLGKAIATSPIATELARTWRALTESDRQQLRDVSSALGQAQYPQSDDNTGDEDFRHLAWSTTELDKALRSLTGSAQDFTAALTHADRLIQQVACLFSHLTTRGTIRRIGNVTVVQQLDGAAGWHTIRSEEDILLSPVRQFDTLGFDHPFPRGVMLVEGIKEEYGRHHFAVTVYGRILPDSTDLAATATPINLNRH
jgi:hypothetical protein